MMPAEGARARLKAWAELLSRRGQAFSIFPYFTWGGINVEDNRGGGASTMTRVREDSLAAQGKLDAGRRELQRVRAES